MLAAPFQHERHPPGRSLRSIYTSYSEPNHRPAGQPAGDTRMEVPLSGRTTASCQRVEARGVLRPRTLEQCPGVRPTHPCKCLQ